MFMPQMAKPATCLRHGYQQLIGKVSAHRHIQGQVLPDRLGHLFCHIFRRDAFFAEPGKHFGNILAFNLYGQP